MSLREDWLKDMARRLNLLERHEAAEIMALLQRVDQERLATLFVTPTVQYVKAPNVLGPESIRLQFPCGSVIYADGPMTITSSGCVSFGGAA